MRDCGIPRERIVVVVNGALSKRKLIQDNTLYCFEPHDAACHFRPIVSDGIAEATGITHWFLVNGTSTCGSAFKDLVESGFDPDADATVAGTLLPLNDCGGRGGRAINDLAMYRHDYLVSQSEWILGKTEWRTQHDILNTEGWLYANAPKQAEYPNVSMQEQGTINRYGTDIERVVEYYPAIDWYRYKKNHGHLLGGSYDAGAL